MADAMVEEGIFERRRVSLSRKILAFKIPEVFVAKDRFCEAGLRKSGYLQRACKNYGDYYGAFFEFKRACDNSDESVDFALPRSMDEHRDAFSMRILDVALMRIGGRWQPGA